MSTIIVKSFVTPDCNVVMENIRINAKNCTFTMELSYGTEDAGIEKLPVSGTVTLDLIRWLTVVKPIKVQVKADNEKGYEWIKSGREATTFQRYLSKINFETASQDHDVLHEMIFECHNRSESYAENPFRLFLGKDRATLTLVNLPSKKRITVRDEESGEITNRYSNKTYRYADGTVVKTWIPKSEFRRLILEMDIEREVYEAPQPEPTQD